jgi:hypothetical protein
MDMERQRVCVAGRLEDALTVAVVGSNRQMLECH